MRGAQGRRPAIAEVLEIGVVAIDPVGQIDGDRVAADNRKVDRQALPPPVQAPVAWE